MTRQSGLAALLRAAMMLGLVMALLPRIGVAQNANDGYDPITKGAVRALVVQADGKTLVGGRFATLAAQNRDRIARLNADGSLDAGLNPNTNFDVNRLAAHPCGYIGLGLGMFRSPLTAQPASSSSIGSLPILTASAATRGLAGFPKMASIAAREFKVPLCTLLSGARYAYTKWNSPCIA